MKGEAQGRAGAQAKGQKNKGKKNDKLPKIIYPANRPRWEPPVMLSTPIPKPICPICGKPIEELREAITDKVSGEAAHFDCVKEKIRLNESLGEGDAITYIGGGRFGIVNTDSKTRRYFQIKKIIEWEERENRAQWRGNIADHFSMT